MLTRFALLFLLLAVTFSGCKKGAKTVPSQQVLNPPPAATPVPTPIPTPTKPVIDQNAQVIIFGYHRFEKQVHRPDTEMTPEMFEAQMRKLSGNHHAG